MGDLVRLITQIQKKIIKKEVGIEKPPYSTLYALCAVKGLFPARRPLQRDVVRADNERPVDEGAFF